MSKVSRGQWFVFGMDDGLLRIEPTRRVAVRWLCLLFGGTVRRRYSYGPGSFEYFVGIDSEDQDSAFIMRGDRAAGNTGWDPHQEPLYPYADDPFERVERANNELEESPQRRA